MKVYQVPWRLEPQLEGGYTVTRSALRGLMTEGKTVAENRYEGGHSTLEAATPMSHASNGRKALGRQTGEIAPVRQEAAHHGGVH
jgi:hypothetical protein